jgi:acyl dehydratase
VRCSRQRASRILQDIERLAVRFSAPLFPGDTLTTRIWSLGDGAYGFDAVSGQGATVVKDGRAVLRGG